MRGRHSAYFTHQAEWSDNEPMKPSGEERSLWKLLGLALLNTRGTKSRFWKQFFVTLAARVAAYRA
jgi:hypothetical protein